MYKSIKRIVLFAIATLCIGYSAAAQIKVADENYGEVLTGTKKYYERDVSFDKLFRQMTPREHHGSMMAYPTYSDTKYSMLGDTVYVYKTIQALNILATSSLIPQGYYEITGYIFCTENADSILSSYGLTHNKIYNSDKYNYGKRTIKSLKQDLLRDDFKNLSYYLMYIVLTQIDSNGKEPVRVFLNAQRLPENYTYDWDKYHSLDYPRASENSDYGWHNFIYLRFYNEIKEQFLGKEVYLTHSYHRMVVDKCDCNVDIDDRCDDAIVYDNIKKDMLKLLDEKYLVKDVILHQGRICCILHGEKTGSFAVYTPIIDYTFMYYNPKAYPECGTCFEHTGTPYPTSDIPYLVTTQRYPNFVAGYKIFRVADWQKMNQRKQQKQQAKKRQESANKQAEKSVLITKYGSEYGELVANKQVALDMTKEMCRDAWGKPMNTYRTTTKYGQTEVWCYNYKTRVYFHNGKVIQIDD